MRLWILLGVFVVSCGGTSPGPATHAHFQAIQRHEATLDEARTPALEGECAEQCEAVSRGCRAAERICEIAEGTTDADAQLRCRAARERCAQYRAASESCACR
ncbi:MAG: hypothetical protein AAGE52_22725 [Myxococcota bacterium]